MPIYEYHCSNCNKTFESLVLGSEQPECPVCRSTDVCKLMSACGFISKENGGQTVKKAAGTSACSGCTASSCSGCGH
jgi:putative FmdB family regulatory protein